MSREDKTRSSNEAWPQARLSLAELVEITGGELCQPAATPSTRDGAVLGRIVTDSREIRSGDVFWALPGKHHDGAEFAADALERGACGIVCGPHKVEVSPNHWLLCVDDSLRALWRLAADRRARFTGRVVAVTGSVGKTTTRSMIDAVLGRGSSGFASPKNYNNHVGLPLSILALSPEYRYAVFELAASARGEIASLAELCSPEIGVITRIGDAHLAGFGNRQGVAEAKAELLAALPPGGRAVLNGDDAWLRKIAGTSKASILWVGRGTGCDVTASNVRSHAGCLSFDVDGQRFEMPVWGRHHLTSALTAIAVGRLFDIPDQAMASALHDFSGPAMRCQVSQRSGATIIDDSYNASPTAMRAALKLLREIETTGRRIAIIGDMLELGSAAEAAHRRLGEDIVVECGADRLVACGEFADVVVAAATRAGMPARHAVAFRDMSACLARLGQLVEPGDVVLVKGSRGLAMERVVHHLSDTIESHPSHVTSAALPSPIESTVASIDAAIPEP